MFGWISIHRKLQCHWLWKEKPFTKGQAWIDLLLTCNHEPIKVDIKDKVILCNRGESLQSLETWSRQWGWSKSKVRRFLKLLQNDNMIVLKSEHKTTHLKVLYYNKYQDKKTRDEPIVKQKRIKDEPIVKLNNNDNNDNNEIIKTIVLYLNAQSGKHFKSTSQKTKDLINTRLSDGFILDDFKKVIDNKCFTWLSNPKMDKFLRPETLFGNKFEGYLNEIKIKETKPMKWEDHGKGGYDDTI